LQDIPGCGKFRKQGLQNVDKLELCFGSLTNIGVDHWSPHMANASPNGRNEIHMKVGLRMVAHKKRGLRMVAPMKVKNLHRSMQTTKDNQGLFKIKARSLKQGLY
jgi:hypothetical protein